MIEIKAVRKNFGHTVAVKDISLSLEPGKSIGLLGPNGAGKTTCLRMLCGLISPDGGSINIDGVDVKNDPIQCQMKLGVLPDNCGLYTRLTAFENIEYFAKLYGLAPNTIKQRINDLCMQLDMGSILHRKTAGFSQGERMKVALARALVHNPPYLILDEPTNGLDVLTTRAVRDLLKNKLADGVGIIFSSHLMHEVEHLCQDITIVINGAVRAQGARQDVITQSQTSDLESAFAAYCSESQSGDVAHG